MHSRNIQLLRVAARRAERRLHGWRKDDSGFTAVEFALIALPFLMLVMGIILIGMHFFTVNTLENAVEQTSRLIRTGQQQSQNLSAAAFKQQVCDLAARFVECGKVRVDVQSAGNCSGITPPTGLDGGGNLKANFNFPATAAGDCVLVTVYYEWDLPRKIPSLKIGPKRWGLNIGNMGNGSRLLQAASAFRNEPFGN